METLWNCYVPRNGVNSLGEGNEATTIGRIRGSVQQSAVDSREEGEQWDRNVRRNDPRSGPTLFSSRGTGRFNKERGGGERTVSFQALMAVYRKVTSGS